MSHDRTDVLVLGAGVAGLAAARSLAEHGIRAIVLEARERIGGRIWTVQPPAAPLPIELGAEFLHGEAPSIAALAREHSLPLVEVLASHWGYARDSIRELPRFEESLQRSFEKVARTSRSRGERSFAEARRRGGLPILSPRP